jgi:hypothetical protein
MSDRWTIVSANELPFPRHLFRCILEYEHLRILESIDENEPPRYQRAWEQFAREHRSEMWRCEYHDPDWVTAAKLAVQIVESGRADGALIDYAGVLDEVVRANKLGCASTWVMWSFFEEPILVGGDELGNGQHRTCALKAAGVARCPIGV